MSYIYNLTDTWNSGATSYNGIKMAITNTASAATSYMLNLSVSGTTTGSFTLDRSGALALNTTNFVVTSAGNVGIGTASPSSKLTVVGSEIALLENNTADYNSVKIGSYSAGGYAYILADKAGTASYLPLLFYTGGSERMRIDSAGNVGIGTSSPSSYATLTVNSAASYQALFGDLTTIGTAVNVYLRTSGVATIGTFGANGALAFNTSSTERLRIDSAGNVGIGVVPSTWYTGYKVIDLGSSVAMYRGASAEAGFAQNAYVNASGAYTYKTSSFASAYEQLSGQHKWFTAPSGTAGNTITFTQAMTLAASGNVAIGTTTTTNRLTVDTALGGTVGLQVNSSVASGYASTLIYGTTTSAASAGFDMLGLYANSVAQFRVTGAGVIYAQNTTVQAISDIRLKDNIRNAVDGLSTIIGLRPVRFDWKDGYGNNRKNQLGFIAQEVEAVFPDAVDEMKISNDSDEKFKTVGPSALIPVLVKAVQELAAELQALKDKING